VATAYVEKMMALSWDEAFGNEVCQPVGRYLDRAVIRFVVPIADVDVVAQRT
jgi:hypothetical protein